MDSTSLKEIQRQHNEAAQLVDQMLPFAAAKCNGEIPLSNKARPIYSVEDKSLYEPYWTSRGHAAVEKLQDLVREGYNLTYDSSSYPSDDTSSQTESTKLNKKGARSKEIRSTTNLWDPINASKHNVAICRPSHDSWGIHKIIFLFCDDFLQRSYALPWWHGRPDIQQAVQPILDVLKINSDSIIRLLLASLPPGTTIPVHEDSGAWVSRTHRIHVPIIVEHVNNILFRCGPSADAMERIDTTPGHVFEMNNQAKHAVSNCSSDYRVHLILDYIGTEDNVTLPPRINLDPGEVLVQTRRSVDRWKDRGSRPTPSFVIIGAQKAGTTSLYEYLGQHPLIAKAKRRETHCLDWRWNAKLKSVNEQRKWCHQFFEKDKLYRNPSCLTGDSTPSYLIDSRRVIPRLKKVFDWPMKFFVMLRDPIKRAESHYAMVTSTQGTAEQLKARGSEWKGKPFKQVAIEDLQNMQQCGLIPYWDIENGAFDEKVFQSFCGSEKEDKAWDEYIKGIPLNTGSYSLVSRGLYELNLRPWLRAFDKSDFLILRMERFKSDGVSSVMEEVWQHIGVPSYHVEDDSPQNTRDYTSQMDSQLQSYLKRFYEPHNQRLAVLLGDDWRGVWDKDDEQENFPQQT
ncbi:hypothetical protein ACA910_018608 [Epithemia clementina (nom. ined.)]